MTPRPLALVTGGCRRLGAAIAARLAAAGHHVALHSGHHATPEGELAAILAECAVDWAAFPADFGKAGAAEALYGAVCARFRRAPDLLVNNAAIFEDDGLATADRARLDRHMAVNLAAPLALMRALAGEGDAGAGRRSVVNILDQRLAHLHVDQLSYSLSKAALAALGAIAAQHPALRVNAVAPGLSIPIQDYLPDQLERLAALMPLARLPQPEDVAAAVHFLATTPALSGQTLYVDGGAHLVAYPRDFVALAR